MDSLEAIVRVSMLDIDLREPRRFLEDLDLELCDVGGYSPLVVGRKFVA